MKVSLLTLSIAAAVSAESQCPGASVYTFNGNSQSEHKDTIATLNLHQAQLVLANFVGVGQYYSAKDANFPPEFKHSCSGRKGIFGNSDDETLNGKAPTAVVVVNGLPEDKTGLFLQSENDNLDNIISPAFNIEEAPSSSFFRALFDKFSTEVAEVYNGEVKTTFDKAVSVISHFVSDLENAAYEGLTNAGIFKRSVRHMDDGSTAAQHRHQDELQQIQSLAYDLTKEQTAFIRVESLSMLNGTPDYEKALESITESLKSLINSGSNLKLMVIASPQNSCTNKVRTMIKRSSSSASTGIFKRENLLTSKIGPYASKEKCEEATDSCSGHGSCHKLASGFYGCACKKSYDTDKKKTTYYGGSACEKIDVSAETQMFLWSAIVGVFVLYASIKLLFSIGDDALPGILNVAKRSSSSQ